MSKKNDSLQKKDSLTKKNNENNEKKTPKDRKTHLQVMFGLVVRQKRIPLALSQEQLAEMSNLHCTYISSVERGERNITLGTIAKIAEALQCSLKDLMPY